MAGKGSSSVAWLIVIGNVVILLSGLALFAETIWATTDPYKVYPILGVTGKDDVFAGGWIAIFCGFAFFLLGIYGIAAVLKGSRTMVMVYLVLMLIVYIFECASCITSFTHRDYMINSNVIVKQMLTYYTDTTTPQGKELTQVWNRIMIEKQCCGVSGPGDWVNYTSTFRTTYSEDQAPWPFLCCKRDLNYIIKNQDGCRVGHTDYINTQGCSDHIVNAINSYTWGISWFGFAILMWTLLVMLLTMYYYTTL
ncbi:uroplakin-1a [Rhinatrema bivittatum]|uniref:uroplakin-1a n=1 Tax=Rhinatrema bivittatum TaxID=194408 RepID=UPI001126E923|nr:uroplakin-1a [Rhinatrema bivittatum]XP_029433005.1 uroplakin-1a [Rhinatrema bivittatum]